MKDLLDRAERAEEQMHMVETLILRQEEAQRTSASAQETLQRFLVEFHAGEHMVCYDALQEAGLLPRLTKRAPRRRRRSTTHSQNSGLPSGLQSISDSTRAQHTSKPSAGWCGWIGSSQESRSNRGSSMGAWPILRGSLMRVTDTRPRCEDGGPGR